MGIAVVAGSFDLWKALAKVLSGQKVREAVMNVRGEFGIE